MKIGSILAAASIAIGAVTVSAEPEHVQRELIVGGNVIPQGSKTYVASLRYTVGGDAVCGGVLISPYHVLTSPLCVADGRDLPPYMAVGTHYLGGTEDGEYFEVVSGELHPDIDFFNATSLFAIITLHKPSTMTPIQLPNASDSGATTGTMLKVMGWGEKEDPFVYPTRELRGVNVPMWSNTDCLQYYNYMDWTSFCAGGVQGEDSCLLDQGGPIVIEGENGNPDILIGLSIDGIGCGGGIPSIYSRVSAGLDWINSVISSAATPAI